MASDRPVIDVQLIAALKKDSRKAFSLIYERYSEPLYLHIRRRLGNREDARDLLQDLFVSLWLNRHSLEPNTNLSAYLFTAAKYKVINFVAHLKVKDKVLGEIIHEPSLTADITDHRTRERLLHVFIEREISQLPEKMQVIFRMSRQEHLTHKEIADVLQISETTVKKQVSNAIKVLRPKLGTLLTATLSLFL